jgi:hypothetical protein
MESREVVVQLLPRVRIRFPGGTLRRPVELGQGDPRHPLEVDHEAIGHLDRLAADERPGREERPQLVGMANRGGRDLARHHPAPMAGLPGRLAGCTGRAQETVPPLHAGYDTGTRTLLLLVQ